MNIALSASSTVFTAPYTSAQHFNALIPSAIQENEKKIHSQNTECWN